MHVGALADLKRASDHLELELQAIVSHHGGEGRLGIEPSCKS